MKIAEEIFQDLTPIPSRLTGYGFQLRPIGDGSTEAVYRTSLMACAFDLTVHVRISRLASAAFGAISENALAGKPNNPNDVSARPNDASARPNDASARPNDASARLDNGSPAPVGAGSCINNDETAQFSVTVRLTDTDTGDDYAQVDNASYVGAYVGAVRQAVRTALEDIADACFYRSGNAWIIPANPRHYDIFQGFADDPDHTLFWTQRLKVAPGDLVFVYHTEPIASLACRCEVVAADIPTDDGDGFTEGKHLMLLRLIERYPPGMYPRAFLNAHGINKTVRGQRTAPPELVLAVLNY